MPDAKIHNLHGEPNGDGVSKTLELLCHCTFNRLQITKRMPTLADTAQLLRDGGVDLLLEVYPERLVQLGAPLDRQLLSITLKEEIDRLSAIHGPDTRLASLIGR